MKVDPTLDSLVCNALDFLDRAIRDFDKAPKYSVIHFCAAVEMFLKARLMVEHWSLVVSKPESANLREFRDGDFSSVTLAESRDRLRDIVGEDIGEEAFKSFRDLARHRNKMIHFFHVDIDGSEDAKAAIVAEQCRAWYHLNRLLTTNWAGELRKYRSQLSKADTAMKAHRKYLDAKFKALEGELKRATSDGAPPQPCSVCGFKSAVPEGIDDHLATLKCLVCDYEEIAVRFDCPHCDDEIEIAGEGYANCPKCGDTIKPEHIAAALIDRDEMHRAIKDGADGREEANCGTCEGYHTVVYRGDFYFCSACFERSDSVEDCGWCNEPNTGDIENSHFVGCTHCEGYAGHTRDD